MTHPQGEFFIPKKKEKHKTNWLDQGQEQDSPPLRPLKIKRTKKFGKKRGEKSKIPTTTGVITTLYSGCAFVLLDSKKTVLCSIKKNLGSLNNLNNQEPLVGDSVEIEVLEKSLDMRGDPAGESGGSGRKIIRIFPRKNTFQRFSYTKKDHPLVSNIDFLLGVMSVTHPDFNSNLLDRYFIQSTHQKIPFALVLSKVDLGLPPTLLSLLQFYSHYYPFPLFKVSSLENSGNESLLDFITQKVCFLFGQSGVGKSTLFNNLFGEERVRTGELRKGLFKGAHTTTESLFFPLHEGGLIDSPGVRLVELGPIFPEKLKNYFPEFLIPSLNCKLPDCHHIHEPFCEIQSTFPKKGLFYQTRLESYVKLFHELKFELREWWKSDPKKN